MAGEPGGISASVRRQLAEGRSRDEIVASIVAGGLSKLSAERFVDREIGAQLPPLPPLEPLIPNAPPPSPADTTEAPAASAESDAPFEPTGTMYEGPQVGGADQIDRFFSSANDDDAKAEADARRDIRIGSYATTIGIALTLITMLFPGRGVLFYGAVVYGIFRFVRGVIRFSRLDTPFPWGRIIAMAALPIVSFPVMFFAVASFAIQRDMAFNFQREMTDPEFQQADVESARLVRKQAGHAYELRQRRTAASVDALVETLNRSSNGRQCEPAAQLARSKSELAVEPLLQYLRQTPQLPQQVQICLVRALADLGEIDHAMGYYRSWMEGDNQSLYMAGVLGFGEIGPDAARVALPLLTSLIESERQSDRYVAADTLAKLGPDAAELLKVLAEDTDTSVRTRANQALKQLQ